MRFFVLTVLSVLALATVATGGVVASPQPTANSTATPNATATATPNATATATTTPTATPGEDLGDALETDPRNATLDDVQTVADWLQSEGADRGGEQADRARDWLTNATADRNITVPNISLGDNATATQTPVPTEPPAPDSDGNATRIDSATEIVASEYLPKKGVARVTIRSETVQNIVFSDGGFLSTGGGKGDTRVESFGAGETSTVQIPVTEVNGRAAVVIATENTPLYGVIVKEGGGGLDVIRELEPLQALIIGVVVAFTWMVIAGWNELRGERGRPEVA
ncbi:hypothetical protein [Halosimplex amylolyticum]|uniref:hypothetical protein n=1 Tax=Halosimplex amylolyticum TaxID=3396616 RepID=UPI003F546A03